MTKGPTFRDTRKSKNNLSTTLPRTSWNATPMLQTTHTSTQPAIIISSAGSAIYFVGVITSPTIIWTRLASDTIRHRNNVVTAEILFNRYQGLSMQACISIYLEKTKRTSQQQVKQPSFEPCIPQIQIWSVPDTWKMLVFYYYEGI